MQNNKKMRGNSPMKNAMEKYGVDKNHTTIRPKTNMQRSYSTKFSNEFGTSKSSELFKSVKGELKNPES